MISILVVRAGGLGDVALALPAIAALRNRFPEARIDVAGDAQFWSLAGATIDSVVSLDRGPLSTLFSTNPSSQAQSFLRRYDTLVFWTAIPPPVAGWDWVSHRSQHASPFPPPGVHATLPLLHSLSPLVGETAGLSEALIRPEVAEAEEATEFLRSMGLTRPVFIHPGGGASWKRWPAKNFAAVCKALRIRGEEPVLIEGPADRDVIEKVQRRLVEPVPVISPVSVRQLVAVLAQGRALVGNDSGVTHVAAALGIPTVAIFGPTDPTCWAPVGATVVRECQERTQNSLEIRVCRAPSCLEGVSVDRVLKALSDSMSITMASTC